MITAAVLVGVALAYLAVGLVYARSQAVRVHKQVSQEWRDGRFARRELRFQLINRVLFWWVFLLVGIGNRVLDRAVLAPVDEREQRAEKLRADIEHWRAVADDEINDEKRVMAVELVRVLTEQLRGMDQ